MACVWFGKVCRLLTEKAPMRALEQAKSTLLDAQAGIVSASMSRG